MQKRRPETNREEMPGKRAIEAQLERISQSAEFDSSRRSIDFLQFVVKKTLADRAHEISQHSIALAVFDRGDDFDPATDPIVRMQAGRVRRCLEHYYLTAGAADPVLIELPKGTYMPVFSCLEPAVKALPLAEDMDTWPTLFVSPLRNLTGRKEVEFIAQGLAYDLAAELGRDASLHVFLLPSSSLDQQRPPARFELAGAVSSRGDDLKINLRLLDCTTGRQIWAQTCLCPAGPDQGAKLDKTVQTTVATIIEEHGILSQYYSRDARERPSVGAAYLAILKYHRFEVTRDALSFAEAFAALRQALKINPDCALCWSYLARLGAGHWSLGLPGKVIPIEESMAAARRGVSLAPRDVRCRVILAYVLLVTDEVEHARREAEIALRLSGMSVMWLDTIGYLLTLSGDWDKGPELIRRAVRINPFPRGFCYSALWLDAFRRGDQAAALAAVRQHASAAHFWQPLMEAVTGVMADRAELSASAVERLLRMKPDFSAHARWLITRHIKSDELACRIEEALYSAGLPHAAAVQDRAAAIQ